MKSNREFLDGIWTRVGILESEEQQVRLAKHRDRSMTRRMLGSFVGLVFSSFSTPQAIWHRPVCFAGTCVAYCHVCIGCTHAMR